MRPDDIKEKEQALIQAIIAEDVKEIENLLHEGVDPDIHAKPFSPMELAVMRDRPDIIRILFKAGASLSGVSNARIPLHYAAKLEHIQCIHMLASLGAKINIRNDGGFTALDIATSNEKMQSSLALYEYGALGGDAQNMRKFIHIPLHYAAWKGHPYLLKTAITAAKDINLTCQNGDTPLHIATIFGKTEAVRMLLEANANPLAANKHGETARSMLLPPKRSGTVIGMQHETIRHILETYEKMWLRRAEKLAKENSKIVLAG